MTQQVGMGYMPQIQIYQLNFFLTWWSFATKHQIKDLCNLYGANSKFLLFEKSCRAKMCNKFWITNTKISTDVQQQSEKERERERMRLEKSTSKESMLARGCCFCSWRGWLTWELFQLHQDQSSSAKYGRGKQDHSPFHLVAWKATAQTTFCEASSPNLTFTELSCTCLTFQGVQRYAVPLA